MNLGSDTQSTNHACTAVMITVTDAHVRRQERGNCHTCAVALAIKEHLCPDLEVHVTGHSWQVPISQSCSDYWIYPQFFELDTQRFIALLDAGSPVTLPHIFTTHVPNEYLKDCQ